MRKIELDFTIPRTKMQVHEYLKEKFNFPDYYGENLDALYECLTEICEPTAVGMLFTPFEEEDPDLAGFYKQLKQVFRDAEQDNDVLAVFVMER